MNGCTSGRRRRVERWWLERFVLIIEKAINKTM
jgi:hypothetical protein